MENSWISPPNRIAHKLVCKRLKAAEDQMFQRTKVKIKTKELFLRFLINVFQIQDGKCQYRRRLKGHQDIKSTYQIAFTEMDEKLVANDISSRGLLQKVVLSIFYAHKFSHRIYFWNLNRAKAI